MEEEGGEDKLVGHPLPSQQTAERIRQLKVLAANGNIKATLCILTLGYFQGLLGVRAVANEEVARALLK